jgi:hypothetical protein
VSTMAKRAPEQPQPASGVADLIQQAERTLETEILQAEQFLSSARERLRRLAEIRTATGTAISARPHSGPFRYANMKANEAMLLYLDRVNHAVPREELIAEVLDGGVYTGKGVNAKGEAEAQINKSITIFLMSEKTKKGIIEKNIKRHPPKLRELNGLVGRVEWPDDKFKPTDASKEGE